MMIKARQQKGAPDAPQQTAEELREAQAADAAAEREAAAQELAFTDADHAGLEQDLAAAEAERAALAARRREAFAALEEARSAVRELQQRKAAKRHTARFERDSGARAREHEAKQVAKRDASDVGGGADEARRHKAATTLARVVRGRQVRREMRAPLWAMHGQPGAPMELRRASVSGLLALAQREHEAALQRKQVRREKQRLQHALKAAVKCVAPAAPPAKVCRIADGTGAVWKKADPNDPVAQIALGLKKNMKKVLDLFREWDENGDGEISKKEFKQAIKVLKIESTPDAVNALFERFDADGNGTIDFKELNTLVRVGSLIKVDPTAPMETETPAARTPAREGAVVEEPRTAQRSRVAAVPRAEQRSRPRLEGSRRRVDAVSSVVSTYQSGSVARGALRAALVSRVRVSDPEQIRAPRWPPLPPTYGQEALGVEAAADHAAAALRASASDATLTRSAKHGTGAFRAFQPQGGASELVTSQSAATLRHLLGAAGDAFGGAARVRPVVSIRIRRPSPENSRARARVVPNAALPPLKKGPHNLLVSEEEDQAQQRRAKRVIRTESKWVSANPDDPLTKIAEGLRKHFKKVLDLFREWDENGDGEISKEEFKSAMRVLKIESTPEGVDALFERFDAYGNGTIDFTELKKLVRAGSLIKVKKVFVHEPTLDELRLRAAPRGAREEAEARLAELERRAT